MRFTLLLASVSVGVASAQDLVVEKRIVLKDGQYLESKKGLELPEGMVVQGAEVHYRVRVAEGSGLDPAQTKFHFSFKEKRGDVDFQMKQGAGRNFFRADWYGENVVLIRAKDMKSGKMAEVEDKVQCHFAARRVLGGEAEKLSEEERANIRRGDLHDVHASSKGMAYLPGDISRGDRNSEQIKKGFFETTEPRIFKTSKGTLIAATQARRIGKNDAPTGQGIVIQRSTDFGAEWSSGFLLDQNGKDVWGYSALVEVDGVLYCYVVAGHPGHQDANNEIRGMYFYTSKDDGKTWSTRQRHDQLSEALGIELGRKIPNGASPNCNILVVPGMSIDGKVAPEGQGLLFSTYAHGFMWASIDGGKQWQMVGDCKKFADAKSNGYGKPVQIENELAWAVLDNAEGDIYMAWRRQSFKGYKNEYVVSKDFKSGPLGMQVKALHNQELKNLPARRCHFGMRGIESGPDKGKVLVASQGSGSRNHIQLYRTKQAIHGNATISAEMYEMATVMQGIAWGYCDLEYLSADNKAYAGLGQDGILLFGESEPVHESTYQWLDLKPNGKGKDERYTATAFLLSVEYFNFLLAQ
ncbi:sialidase family protein [Rubritalea tangerina]|uniref:exo-alpha-sialidase n=1 Tax=Rubritalea tangerina TaxID=430798 RepID=A0ABW4ZED7_9BACT